MRLTANVDYEILIIYLIASFVTLEPKVRINDASKIVLTCVSFRVAFGNRYCGGVPACAVVPITTFIRSLSRDRVRPMCSWRIAPSRTSHWCLSRLLYSLFCGKSMVPLYHISGTSYMMSSALLLFRQPASLHWIALRKRWFSFSDLCNSSPGKIALPLDIHTLEKRFLLRREPINAVTRVPPARCPHRVTDDLLPPKCSMFNCTH